MILFSDYEPQLICVNCKRELTQSFAFRQKCNKTQEVLNTISAKESVQVKSEEESTDIKPEICEETGLLSDNHDSEDNFQSNFDDGCNDENESKLEGANNIDNFTDWNTVETVASQKPSRLKSTHNKARKRKYQKERIMCDTCGKLMNKDLLNDHIRMEHSGLTFEEMCYTCDLCGNRLKHRPSLLMHMKMFHLKQVNRERTCEVCGATFKNGQLVLCHKRKVHTDLYPMSQCQYCDYKTPYTSKYKLHVMSHLGEAVLKHQCTICSRKFLQLRRLRDHMATHSDRRDFVCNECGAAFKTNGALGVHVRGVHSTQKGNNATLRRFFTFHFTYNSSYSKGYECPVCSRSFGTNQNLRFHVTKQHPEYELPPPGTVLKKNAARPYVFASGFSLALQGLQTSNKLKSVDK